MITADYLKGSGKMIRDMVEVMRDTQTAIFIKGSFSMARLMARADINGYKTRRYMTESGQKG